MIKMKILIVEDDYDLGALLKYYLSLNQIESKLVSNGIEAREILKADAFDILIVDIMMPREDGFTLAQKLKVQYPDLPFIFVTARSMQHDVLTGLKMGADDYITKPFDPEELILRVNNILKKRRKK